MSLRGWWRLLGSAVLASVVLGGSTQADLAGYVKKAEPKYSWKQTARRVSTDGTVYDLALVSQVWQGITWKHDVQVFVPKNVKPGARVFMWNTGGSPGLRGS